MVVIKTNFTIVIVSGRERGEEDGFGVPGNLYNISEVLFLKLKKCLKQIQHNVEI